MDLRALHDNIIIKPSETEHVTDSGIVLTGKRDSNKTARGVVAGVGPGYTYPDEKSGYTGDVLVGDIVIFERYAGAEVTRNGETYYIMPVMNIIASISE